MSLMHAPNCPVELAELAYPLLASEKVNGFRLMVMGNTLLTKSGIPHANKRLREHFADLLALSRLGWAFDCECYSSELSFPELQSVLQSSDKEIPASVRAYVFDCITIQEFFAVRSPRLTERVERCRKLLAAKQPANTIMLKQRPVNSSQTARRFYDSIRSKSGEGIILRNPAGRYYRGRCTAGSGLIYKVKPETLITHYVGSSSIVAMT